MPGPGRRGAPESLVCLENKGLNLQEAGGMETQDGLVGGALGAGWLSGICMAESPRGESGRLG